jgi:hypothetical protein
MRKGTFYKTSSGQPITLQHSHEYLEKGCMSNPVRHRTFLSATDVWRIYLSLVGPHSTLLHCRVVQGIFSEVAKYSHSRQFL